MFKWKAMFLFLTGFVGSNMLAALPFARQLLNSLSNVLIGKDQVLMLLIIYHYFIIIKLLYIHRVISSHVPRGS